MGMERTTRAEDGLRGRAAEARERFEDGLQSSREQLESNVQNHPLRTILVAAGAGILVGLLLGIGRRRGSD
jgi:ElaB/YqjD/DUF883 family membrane-anchored ribosome-binding protein